MNDITQARICLTLLAIAAALCLFSLGVIAAVGANELERSRPASETQER
jgi:hypothetical protein